MASGKTAWRAGPAASYPAKHVGVNAQNGIAKSRKRLRAPGTGKLDEGGIQVGDGGTAQEAQGALDFVEREEQHGGGEIVYTESFSTLVEARRREVQVKKWSRIKKENLIKGLRP